MRLRIDKLFIPILFVVLFSGNQNINAQTTYGNEWIIIGNTYVKFPVWQDNLYRISKDKLDSLGMSSVPGSQFAIYSKGQEIPIYVSTNGVFGTTDYIEFYAPKADGGIDSSLYANEAFHANDHTSLLSDTAYYFLTYNTNTHQRVTNASNVIPSPAPTPEPYFWYQSPITRPGKYFKGKDIGPIDGALSPSSQFDEGEAYVYSSKPTTSNPTPYKYLSYVKHKYLADPSLNAYLSFTLVGNSETNSTHHPYVKVGSTQVFDTTYSNYGVLKKTLPVSLSLLGAVNNNIYTYFTDNVAYGLAYCSYRYPRLFDFVSESDPSTFLDLPTNNANQYLKFTNFNNGGAAPILTDLTNKKRYIGNVISSNSSDYYIQPSTTDRDLYVTPENKIGSINTFYPVNFIDYSQTTNQGDYIILTHKNYINASPNNINDYKLYRESADGGAYDVVVEDVESIYDQFGYGYEFHPQGVKNFLKYAYDNWSEQPQYLFIIGKGITFYAFDGYTDPSLYSFDNSLVPTWGYPGSDNIFSDFNNDGVPEIATGRLSAWNNSEIGSYLTKIEAYENAIKTPVIPNLDNTLWKKTAIHVAGGSSASLQQFSLLPTLNYCKVIYQDSLLGGKVITVAKNTTDPIQTETDVALDSAINSGTNLISFYGHGSSTSFDYNINDPDVYHPNPKFPIFIGFGCDVAQVFGMSNDKTVGEKYLNSINGGSIAMLASDNVGYTSSLTLYFKELYKQFCRNSYGETFGKQIQETVTNLPSDAMTQYHKECMILQGDPALRIYSPNKADYYTDDAQLSADPMPVTTSIDSFTLKAKVYNLGKATHDSVLVTITKEKAGIPTPLYTDSIYMQILYSDTFTVKIPVNQNTDVGLMTYTVRINPNNAYDEISTMNNKGVLQLFISENAVANVYPQNFAIMHQPGVILKASALNLFGATSNYKFEIDTTMLFNSPAKLSTVVSSQPGVIEWKPNMSYTDSTVYYWRSANEQPVNGQIQWSTSSFVYLNQGADGWNQSHYYQLLNDTPYNDVNLSSTDRKFRFDSVTNDLHVIDRVLFYPFNDYTNISQSLNNVILDNVGCNDYGSIQIVVFDGESGKPWANTYAGTGGSVGQACGHNYYQFEFPTDNAAERQVAKAFLDNIPDSSYVLIKNYIYGGNINTGAGIHWNGQTVDQWQLDANTYGTGNTLYDKLIDMGFTDINQYNAMKTFIFFRRKGVSSYPIHQVISQDSLEIITLNAQFNSYPIEGSVTSTIIGPAQNWSSLKWKTTSYNGNPQNDISKVKVYGINNQQQETLLYTVSSLDTSLSSISASQYPNIKLVWSTFDSANRTTPNLDYWRVLYTPVPEAALNPLSAFYFNSDTLTQGQDANIKIGIKNLTPYLMDSMLVSYHIVDANNVPHLLGSKRYQKLLGNDSLVADFTFNPSQYIGRNNLMIEANPNKDQPEQYHPNNIGYFSFYVNQDKTNPILDVTFDGVHILDKDLVSAKPFIKVMMLDDNKYAALKDTSLMTLKLTYPPDANGNSVEQNIPFDGTICKFIPADINQNGKNQASIEYKPTLLQDGVYKLTVSGKDDAGNQAGSAPVYQIEFMVDNKPTITNVLNYPNPFSTSTAFVFTLTGSEVPQQFKIQIMTVTGKIVREITKNELGPLHIGRNITDYKWDGKDQFGQLLGNGVYLYRVVTSLDGKDVEHRANTNVDKYFKNSFGKMYIMR